ncbi:MAG: retropepsin-like domain-containing protein [Methanobrevibacter sp.]|jgi:hypothetical protein|nr:retropepsin-like domain-containing protein [Candidatus Methanoflexus mossambicus]
MIKNIFKNILKKEKNNQNTNIIVVKFKNNIKTKALLDTGSYGKNSNFINNKLIKKLNLQNQIYYINETIETISDKLQLKKCILLEFYINDKYYKKKFYILDLDSKDFDIILGYDFLKQNNIININI